MEPTERPCIVDVKVEVHHARPPRARTNLVLEYPPYASYDARSRRLTEFLKLTSISYELAQQLLFSTPRNQLAEVVVKEPTLDQLSYSMADRIHDPVEMEAA